MSESRPPRVGTNAPQNSYPAEGTTPAVKSKAPLWKEIFRKLRAQGMLSSQKRGQDRSSAPTVSTEVQGTPSGAPRSEPGTRKERAIEKPSSGVTSGSLSLPQKARSRLSGHFSAPAKEPESPPSSPPTTEPASNRLFLIGMAGAGKSTVANMLVQGQLQAKNIFPTSSSVTSPAAAGDVAGDVVIRTGRDWYVVDTPGLGLLDEQDQDTTAKTLKAIKRVCKAQMTDGDKLFAYVVKKERIHSKHHVQMFQQVSDAILKKKKRTSMSSRAAGVVSSMLTSVEIIPKDLSSKDESKEEKKKKKGERRRLVMIVTHCKDKGEWVKKNEANFRKVFGEGFEIVSCDFAFDPKRPGWGAKSRLKMLAQLEPRLKGLVANG